MSARIATEKAPHARVLVVDDEDEVRASVGRVVTALGYEVGLASSGEQALDMVARTPYDVAIFDIRLPDLNGIEVMRRAAGIRPSMAAILLTGYGSLDTAIEALRARAVDYLCKPASVGEIACAIAAALERRAGTLAMAGATADRFVQAGSLTLDREQRLATVNAGAGLRVVSLTRTEATILSHLIAHPGVAVTCRELAGVLGYAETEGEARPIVRPHISRLRRKIEPDPASPRLIVTVSGLGYTLGATHPPSGRSAGGP